MSGVPIRTKTGPRTYVPAELVLGGQLVEARGQGRVGVAGAGSFVALGFALLDAINPEGITTEPVIANGRAVLNAAPLPTLLPVSDAGQEVSGVKFAAATAFGTRLKAAANGAVTPFLAGDDARLLIGKCTSPNGVAANALGLVTTI